MLMEFQITSQHISSLDLQYLEDVWFAFCAITLERSRH